MLKTCKFCNKEYVTVQSNSKFCSIKCGQRNRKNEDNSKQLKNFKILRWAKRFLAYDLFDNKCSICGDTNHSHFVFHHTNPKHKEIKMARLWQSTWFNIKKELTKCILLCENCHKELHHNEKTIDGRHRHTKNLLVNYKGNKCEKCGYSKINDALIFHHKNKSDKTFSIGDYKIRLSSIADLTNSLAFELDKCELLCANCHRDAHEINIDDIKKDIFLKKITIPKQKVNKKINVLEVKRLSFIEKKNSKEIAKILNCSSSAIRNVIKRIKEENI